MKRAIGVWVLLSLIASGCASDPMTSGPNTGAGGTLAPGGQPAAASGSGAAPAGAGNANCAALPPASNPDDVVADFEEGTGAVLQVGGRGGGFYMYNDGTGMQNPPTGMLPPAVSMNRCMSKYALCMSGKNFMTWGAGMGTDLAPTSGGMGMGAKQTYDASKYKGVAFWAKSNGPGTTSVRVSFKDSNTAPEGGKCDMTAKAGAEQCNDDWGKSVTFTPEWTPAMVSFAEIKQSGWGKAFTAFEDKSVYSIQFQVSQGVDFDVCIDDLQFLR
ncbi:MAG TPA: hypothetical protein VJV78_31210 [Polyangiales bacterium]|nr:hypothetical protein [Polyangiales bacterium]